MGSRAGYYRSIPPLLRRNRRLTATTVVLVTLPSVGGVTSDGAGARMRVVLHICALPTIICQIQRGALRSRFVGMEVYSRR